MIKKETLLRVKWVIISIIVPISLMIIYFIAAGTLNLLFAWIFFSLYLTNFIIMSIIKNRRDLIEERISRKKDAKKWDYIYNRIYPIILLILYIFSG